MPLGADVIAAIIGGGASLAGGALANRSSSSSTQTPTILPEYKGLQDLVLQQTKDRLMRPVDTTGYTANGIATINRTSDLARQNVENSLTARGLAASPVAGNAAAVAETGRASQVAGFQNSIPLLIEEMQRQRLTDANTVMRGGFGATATGTSAAGGGAGGAFENLAGYLGYLQGKGAFASSGAPLAARQTVPNVGMLPTGGPY